MLGEFVGGLPQLSRDRKAGSRSQRFGTRLHQHHPAPSRACIDAAHDGRGESGQKVRLDDAPQGTKVTLTAGPRPWHGPDFRTRAMAEDGTRRGRGRMEQSLVDRARPVSVVQSGGRPGLWRPQIWKGGAVDWAIEPSRQKETRRDCWETRLISTRLRVHGKRCA